MSVMDLFRPTWKHSNSSVRMASVEKLDDKNLLAMIAQTDKDSDVRKTAVGNLDDQELLANIVITDHSRDVQMAALTRVTEQASLVKIAQKCRKESVAEDALKKLEDQSLIASVAVYRDQSRNVTCKAIGMLNDQHMLARVIKEVEDTYLIQLAVKGISDEGLLLQLLSACNDNLKRLVIIEHGHFTDEVLVDLAGKYPESSRYAIERIKNQGALAKFALNSSSVKERLSAVEKLNDQELLKNIAQNDQDLSIRVIAIGKLEDKTLAQKISNDVQTILNNELGSKQFPNAWLTLAHGPQLISILRSQNKMNNNCPYNNSGVCMFRVKVYNDTSYGPEECSFGSSNYVNCFVWQQHPK